MKLIKIMALGAIIMITGLFSCQKEKEIVQTDNSVSPEVLSKIYNLGFGTDNVQRIPEGYLVEGDIILTDHDLNDSHDHTLLRVGEEEQYRTTRLVTRLPRVIRVKLSSQLPSSYAGAVDDALRRFNREQLKIRFSRITDGTADIVITKASSDAMFLASAGFPTSSGNPYNQVLVNSTYLGRYPNRAYLATILAHEIGHCIGFRHTDYMDRSYSCNGIATNEGAANIGAIRIPGTPSKPDANSWMLACIDYNQDRPFTANDKIALQYLYK